MSDALQYRFSGPVTVFHDRRLPEEALPVGYAALIDAYRLPVPVPLRLAAIRQRHKIYEAEGWRMFTPRHTPHGDLTGHLTLRSAMRGWILVSSRPCSGPQDLSLSVISSAPRPQA